MDVEVRPIVADIVRDATSLDDVARSEALTWAAALIEVGSLKYRSAMAELEFTQQLLPEWLWGIKLNEAELRSLTDALAHGIDLPATGAPTAAFGLRLSRRIDLVPVLAAAARRWAQRDDHAAGQAVIAIQDIVTQVASLQGALTPEQASYAAIGLAAIDELTERAGGQSTTLSDWLRQARVALRRLIV